MPRQLPKKDVSAGKGLAAANPCNVISPMYNPYKTT